jgi:hypothetical protein
VALEEVSVRLIADPQTIAAARQALIDEQQRRQQEIGFQQEQERKAQDRLRFAELTRNEQQRREDEVRRKEEEAKRRAEEARLQAEEARRKSVEARQREAENRERQRREDEENAERERRQEEREESKKEARRSQQEDQGDPNVFKNMQQYIDDTFRETSNQMRRNDEETRRLLAKAKRDQERSAQEQRDREEARREDQQRKKLAAADRDRKEREEQDRRERQEQERTEKEKKEKDRKEKERLEKERLEKERQKVAKARTQQNEQTGVAQNRNTGSSDSSSSKPTNCSDPPSWCVETSAFTVMGEFRVTYRNNCADRIVLGACNKKQDGSWDCGELGVARGRTTTWPTLGGTGEYKYRFTGSGKAEEDWVCNEKAGFKGAAGEQMWIMRSK